MYQPKVLLVFRLMTGLYWKDFGLQRRQRWQCIGENKGLNQIHAADWNPTHNCRQPYNQEKILSLAILINIFSKMIYLFFSIKASEQKFHENIME